MIEYTGSILIDGVELRTIPHGIVRSRFTTLSQDGIRLQESIRLNLDPYSMTDNDKEDRIPAESMIHILTRIGLWGYINQQGGLELDMSAANFSQGQLQLFDIARAMLRKSKTASKIVLLDEVTSSADSETEKRMQDVIADVFSNCTVCMVSHRRDATDKMDKVITLKNGQVVNVSKHHATGTDLSVEAN
jgi:ABC-type multidrug transport system fused ATPase/permease subunit